MICESAVAGIASFSLVFSLTCKLIMLTLNSDITISTCILLEIEPIM